MLTHVARRLRSWLIFNVRRGEAFAPWRYELVIHRRREAQEFLQSLHHDFIHRKACGSFSEERIEVVFLAAHLKPVGHAPVRGEYMFHHIEAASRRAVGKFAVLCDDAFQAPN